VCPAPWKRRFSRPGRPRGCEQPCQPRRFGRQRRSARIERDLGLLNMERLEAEPRPNWREDCESVGFGFHSMDGVYWDEAHCYRFTADEIDELEAATRELCKLSLDAVEHVVKRDRLSQLAIPPRIVDYV